MSGSRKTPAPLTGGRSQGRSSGPAALERPRRTRRIAAVLVTALLTVSAVLAGASPASAHARCDGRSHSHYYWTGDTAWWTHSYYYRQVNRYSPDVTWAIARSSRGETHMNRCFW